MKRSCWQMGSKRLLDILCSLVALCLTAPLLTAVALLLRFTMGKPVLFRQHRPGKNGIPFVLYKFRTMTDARDAAGNPLPDTERMTGLGNFLRSTSLDELPELLNVLRGDMSLVGPRPLLMEYLERYTPEQARRHEMRPGITGWAQTNGRNVLSWEERFELDVWYIDHWSLRLDFKILSKTFGKVLSREGISHPGHQTMPEFLGREKE